MPETNNEFEKLRLECLNCTDCGLCSTRTNVVFGVGVDNAEVMFIGEGPGENEDLQGEPFVGRAGKLLDKMLEAVDLDRHKNIYIANIVKCRPPKNRAREAVRIAPDMEEARRSHTDRAAIPFKGQRAGPAGRLEEDNEGAWNLL